MKRRRAAQLIPLEIGRGRIYYAAPYPITINNGCHVYMIDFRVRYF